MDAGRLAHGLLLIGPAGSGTDHFAWRLAETLLKVDDNPRARVMLNAGSHPDLLVLEPPEPGKAIRVEAVRELIDFLNLTPQYGDQKVAIILASESMNRHAANSLLKTLEEPPGHSQLILVSQQPALLPVTIRSRCQKLELTPYTGERTENWLREQLADPQADAGLLLAVSGNAPLIACELAGERGLSLRNRLVDDLVALTDQRADAVSMADQWNKAGALAVYTWLYRLCCDLVRYRLLGSEAVANRDLQQQLSHLTAGRSLRQVIDYYDLVIKNYYLLTGPYSPNSGVLLEDFILHWQGIVENRKS
ncbi:MAG: DNA polymerase III subunit delta' C-terminal domain-containing protein [Gammaproteobacteria bacterium]|nr:DNA polymerase III subunit delta' C-terminal domain-containing protein [Gammaproteobacteria bacterium]